MIVTDHTNIGPEVARAATAIAYQGGLHVQVPGAKACLPKDRSEWLQLRRAFIGASEVAAIAGLNDYAGPLDVYASKVNGTQTEPNLAMRNGLRLEDDIIEMFAEETSLPVFLPRVDSDLPILYTSTEHSHCAVTPDAFVVENDELGSLQTKSGSYYVRENWDGDVPREYYIQVQDEMLVLGLQFSYLAVFFDITDFRWIRIERDEEACASIAAIAANFWKHVESQTPPPPLDGNAFTHKALERIYPEPTPGTVKSLDEEFVAMHTRREEIAKSIKALEDEKNAINARLKFAIGDNELGVLPDGSAAYKWSVINRKGYTVEPSSYRELRKVKVPKDAAA